MEIKGLDHVNINTSNMEDTLNFLYRLVGFYRGISSSF